MTVILREVFAWRTFRCQIPAVFHLFVLSAAVIIGPSAAHAREERMVEVILDASSSMNQKLKSGDMKLSAEKKAVESLLMRLDGNTVISFRAFGHQSPREKRDCLDTRALTGFSPLIGIVTKMLVQTIGLRALGSAPVSQALSEAVRDFPPDFKGETVVVLVSDGKDTCQGDPCSTAQGLTKDRTKLVIHTIGLEVDDAARTQLECIAKVSGGRYFGAEDPGQLARALQSAVETSRGMIVRKKGEGRLSVEGADVSGSVVVNSETGEKAGALMPQQAPLKLPAGIYTVGIGKSYWESVEVSPGETTVLRPAVIKIEHLSSGVHKVVERETGEELGQISQAKDFIVLAPGEYDIFFGKTVWPVSAGQGAKIVLKPGTVILKGATPQGHRIRKPGGDVVETLSNTAPSVQLPPGDYTIEIDGKLKQFSLKESETLTFQKK
ncbi:MAG: VWA domain-containing protein [Nitrospirae bacterium]|nr:VWA domain-containing protein [Nitrospirota bacterium]